MIIMTYSGIEKSTLASKDDKIIDLPKSCFCKGDLKAFDSIVKWDICYGRVATELSRQGYIVFVDYHPRIDEWLSLNHENGIFLVIFPSPELKEEWIDKLHKKYEISGSDKDLRGYEHVKEWYDTDIREFINKNDFGYYNGIRIIRDMNYDLGSIINEIRDTYSR